MLVTYLPDEMCIHSRFYCQETFPAHLKDDMEMSGIDSAIKETLVLRITKNCCRFRYQFKNKKRVINFKGINCKQSWIDLVF